MKPYIVGILLVVLCSCNSALTKDVSTLNNMTDWNKAEISNKTALEFKKESEMFRDQKQNDFDILNNLELSYNLKKDLFEKWDLLIKITDDMYENKLIGVIQSQKRRVLIKEIHKLKVEINKEIEVINNGKKDSV